MGYWALDGFKVKAFGVLGFGVLGSGFRTAGSGLREGSLGQVLVGFR